MVKFTFEITAENGEKIEKIIRAKDKLDAFAIIKHQFPFAKEYRIVDV